MKIIEIRDNPDGSMNIDVDLTEAEVKVILEKALKGILEDFIENPLIEVANGNEHK